MASFNKVILIGNLTADPELKQTVSGTSVCTFTLAVNRRFKGTDGNTECDFITVVAWRQQAVFVSRYLKKGKPLLVCGQIQVRSWTDRQGQKRYATEVVADEVSFIDSATTAPDAQFTDEPDSAPAASQSAYTPAAYTQPSFSTPPTFEEIPNDESLPF